MAWLQDPFIWTALAQIVLIDLLLGGDNAVVIAMACRRLPRELQTKAIYGGMLGAILLRIVMLFFAVHLLTLPFLKLIGAALLLWIGIKLAANQEEGEEQIDGGTRLWTAIRTVIVADVVMSLDTYWPWPQPVTATCIWWRRGSLSVSRSSSSAAVSCWR